MYHFSMENQKTPFQRHFSYRHPTFGSKTNPKPESAWTGSIYYWWWEYLKRNPEYISCCERGGEGNLADLYQDFGDVRGDNFKAWWTENSRGVNLFAEPRANDSVRALETAEPALDSNEYLTISLPLLFPKRFLQKEFKKLLALHHKGRRGYQNAKKSQAKYRIKGQPNIPAIKQALEVYDFWLAHPEMKLWEIGNALPRFQMTSKIGSDDSDSTTVHNKNILAVTVSRYLKRAKKSIASTSMGVFP